MNKSKMAVLVTSCDAYCDIWHPFFQLMDNYWGDISSKVYLNTETKNFSGNYKNFIITTLNFPGGAKYTWSERMIAALERIEEPYILMLVEDFFLREQVDSKKLEQLIQIMEDDSTIAEIQLFGTRINCDNGKKNDEQGELVLEKIGDDKAKVVFVPTIWRKEILLKWLRPHESIWAFESCASKRAKRWKYKEKVFRVYSPAIFNYLWERGCYCVVNGKWMLHPLLTQLFESNGISIDFEKRGTITMEEWQSVTTKTLIKRNGFVGTLKKIVGRIRSVF